MESINSMCSFSKRSWGQKESSANHGSAFLILPSRSARADLQFVFVFTGSICCILCWRPEELVWAHLFFTDISADLNVYLTFDNVDVAKYIFCKKSLFSDITWLWRLFTGHRLLWPSFCQGLCFILENKCTFSLPLLIPISNRTLEKMPIRRVGEIAPICAHFYLHNS